MERKSTINLYDLYEIVLKDSTKSHHKKMHHIGLSTQLGLALLLSILLPVNEENLKTAWLVLHLQSFSKK